MKKTKNRIMVLICLVLLLAGLGALRAIAIEREKKDETYRELELFADALTFVQSDYADETKPKDLIYGALAGMLNGLDPHSQFLNPEEYEDLKVETEGKFGGIGIEITLKDNLITVITPIEDTPAWDAGMAPNDRIVKIDDTVIKNFTLNEAVKRLRGKPGTEVNIVVWREKEGKLHSFKIKRAMIEVKDIKEAKILEKNIAYLRLAEFREGTPVELDRVLADLRSKGMDSLILDLRNNPGGLLDKAVEVSERFLHKGAVVVSVKGRDKKQNSEYKVNFKSPDLKMPMVLLVNEGSASGSEIVAGAFQDHKRAIVLGTRTFGKGSVQTILPLKDGSALKLTTSRYFTPSGRTIHEKGVAPDIAVEMTGQVKAPEAEKKEELEKIFENVEEKTPENQESKELEKLYSSDAQLSRAVDLLKGIKIYKAIQDADSQEK